MKRLRIAFVSSSPSIRRFRRDASFIYRCENLALALSHRGHKTSLLHISALLVRRDFDIAVFLRPQRSWLFDYVTDRLRKRGAVVVGDADDLIFDPECAQFRPSVRNDLADVAKVRNGFALNAEALAKLDKVQFSTDELARRYLALRPGAQCEVIPNAGFRLWPAVPTDRSASERNISYFSGTRTHDKDFAIVAPVLKKLLNRHEDLTVRIIGPLSLDFEHERVIRVSKVPFKDYPQLVAASYISIAPLEDTPFNQCKSALKTIEAGMMNVPTVVSPIGEFATVRMLGVLHANSEAGWESQLEFALDRENHKRLSLGLRDRTLAYADIDACAEKFLRFMAA
jgi:glycosyltransferase involved in cell wall biosynthesis